MHTANVYAGEQLAASFLEQTKSKQIFSKEYSFIMSDAPAMKSEISIFLCTNIVLITNEAGRHSSVFNMLLQEDQSFWQAEEYREAGAGKDAAVAAGGYGAAEEE